MIVTCAGAGCGVRLRVALTSREVEAQSLRRRYCASCARRRAKSLKGPSQWGFAQGWHRQDRGVGRGLADPEERRSRSSTLGPAGRDRALELWFQGRSPRFIAFVMNVQPRLIEELLQNLESAA